MGQIQIEPIQVTETQAKPNSIQLHFHSYLHMSQFLELGTKLDSEFNCIKSIQQTTSQLWELQNKNCGHVEYWYRITNNRRKNGRNFMA